MRHCIFNGVIQDGSILLKSFAQGQGEGVVIFTYAVIERDICGRTFVEFDTQTCATGWVNIFKTTALHFGNRVGIGEKHKTQQTIVVISRRYSLSR